jgi:RimJ/RimL family protein N-acetyltransferase
MRNIETHLPDIILVAPNPERDAPFAVNWFTSRFGKETLLLMGNAEHEIHASTVESERQIMEEFMDLEKENKQLTWMIRDHDKTIGATWIELIDTPELKSPAVHIMIGDRDYRGKGIGYAVISEMIQYVHIDLQARDVYSRHLANNQAAKQLLASCGFHDDGDAYIDTNKLAWQNVHLQLQQPLEAVEQ